MEITLFPDLSLNIIKLIMKFMDKMYKKDVIRYLFTS